MTKEKWIKSPWTISIGTAIITLFLTMIIDYFKDKPILTASWTSIKWIGNLIWTIINSDLKVWWVILAITLLILILFIIVRLKGKESFKPDYYSYNEDNINGWRWSWEWQFNDSQKSWSLTNLRAHCPKCDTPMMSQSVSSEMHFECPRSDFKSTDRKSDEYEKIEQIIYNNYERKRKEKKINP